MAGRIRKVYGEGDRGSCRSRERPQWLHVTCCASPSHLGSSRGPRLHFAGNEAVWRRSERLLDEHRWCDEEIEQHGG